MGRLFEEEAATRPQYAGDLGQSCPPPWHEVDGAQVHDHVVSCVGHRKGRDVGDGYQHPRSDSPLRQPGHHWVQIDAVDARGTGLCDKLHSDSPTTPNLEDSTPIQGSAEAIEGGQQVVSLHECALGAVEDPAPEAVHPHGRIQPQDLLTPGFSAGTFARRPMAS